MKQTIVSRAVRLGLVSVVALGLVGAQVVAYAQDTQCFGLKADDCQLLTAGSQAPIAKQPSFNLDYDINFKVTGAPDGDVALTVHGTVPFDANGADLTSLSTTGAAGGTSAAMTKLTGLLSKIILGTTIDGSAASKGKNTTFHGELPVLNNKVYINEPKTTQGKWKFLDLKTMAGMMAGMAGQIFSAARAGTKAPAPYATL